MMTIVITRCTYRPGDKRESLVNVVLPIQPSLASTSPLRLSSLLPPVVISSGARWLADSLAGCTAIPELMILPRADRSSAIASAT